MSSESHSGRPSDARGVDAPSCFGRGIGAEFLARPGAFPASVSLTPRRYDACATTPPPPPFPAARQASARRQDAARALAATRRVARVSHGSRGQRPPAANWIPRTGPRRPRGAEPERDPVRRDVGAAYDAGQPDPAQHDEDHVRLRVRTRAAARRYNRQLELVREGVGGGLRRRPAPLRHDAPPRIHRREAALTHQVGGRSARPRRRARMAWRFIDPTGLRRRGMPHARSHSPSFHEHAAAS